MNHDYGPYKSLAPPSPEPAFEFSDLPTEEAVPFAKNYEPSPPELIKAP